METPVQARPKMDAEVKQRWLEALRSGKYAQTRNALRRPLAEDETTEGFCCLGVLCDVLDPNGWEDELDIAGYRNWRHPTGRAATSLPIALEEQLGLTGVIGELIDQNDDGSPFASIADFIEANL